MYKEVEYYNKLTIEARNLNYRISPSSTNKACHYPNFVIFIQKPVSIENIYSFAHEIGHCMDFKRGRLDFEKYKTNKTYRLWKEVVAWYLAFKLCLRIKIPITTRFIKHSLKCLKSYL